MNIIVNGCLGRMGQTVCRMLAEGYRGHALAAGADVACANGLGENMVSELSQCAAAADCVIDFSHHAATTQLLEFCLARRLPVVVATTGQTREERERIASAAERIPVFFSANLSVGAALLETLACRVAAAFPEAEIEIVEAHRGGKPDVPSGTAMMVFEGLRRVRPQAVAVIGRREGGRGPDEIGIHSLRLGDETGTHTVLAATGSQTITLTHRAQSRALFAEGALAAAAFIREKEPGLYDMKDLVEGEKQ